MIAELETDVFDARSVVGDECSEGLIGTDFGGGWWEGGPDYGGCNILGGGGGG